MLIPATGPDLVKVPKLIEGSYFKTRICRSKNQKISSSQSEITMSIFSCICSSALVVAARHGNYSLRKMFKMFLTKHRWRPYGLIFTKNDFCHYVYIKFNICFVKLMLEEIQIDLEKRL